MLKIDKHVAVSQNKFFKFWNDRCQMEWGPKFMDV